VKLPPPLPPVLSPREIAAPHSLLYGLPVNTRQQTGRALDQKTARNTGYLVVAFAAGTLTGIATAILLARGLGEEGLGQFGFTMAVASILGLLADLGVNELTTREVARDPGTSHNLLSRSLRTKAWLCLAYGGIILLAWAWGRPAENPASSNALLLAAPIGFFTFATSAYASVLRGLEAMSRVMWLNIGASLAQLAMVAYVLWTGGGVFALLAGTLCVVIARAGVTAWVLRHIMPESTGEMDRGLFSLVRLSLPFALTTIFYVLYSQMDMLMMGFFSSDAETGYFHVAARAREISRGLPGAFLGALYPALSAALQAPGRNGHRDLKKASLLLMGYGILVAITLMFIAEPAIALVLGERFLPASSAVKLSGCTVAFRVLTDLFLVYLFAAGLERRGPKIVLSGVLLSGLGGWLVIPTWGAVGGAAVVLVTDVFLCVVLTFSIFRKRGDQETNHVVE
jgi:O-antigen/teichoic acid export membrane protein